MTLDRTAADNLVSLAKVIGEPLQWKRVSQSNERWRFKVDIYSSSTPARFQLRGEIGPNYWGYVLLGPNGIPLRRISSPKTTHTNPDGIEVPPTHKHVWTSEFEDRETYVPDDIRWDDHNDALRDFMAECNIKLLHEYDDFYLQPGLEL